MGGLGDVIRGLLVLLPPWAVAAIGLVLLVALGPSAVDAARSRQIRGLLRDTVRADDARRAELEATAVAFAAHRPIRLITLATEAKKRGRTDLFDYAVATLRRIPGHDDDARRLQDGSRRETPKITHPVETAVTVERLIEEGMFGAARSRLDEARARFPTDPELAALSERLAEAEAEADEA